MKFALYSDLHTEFSPHGPWVPPELGVDAVILAGDIGLRTKGLAWAQDVFCQRQGAPLVIYVAGNHEYYRTNLGLLNKLRDPKWRDAGIHFLERETLTLPGVRVLGCTLWSDFSLYGSDRVAWAMQNAKEGMNDFHLIRTLSYLKLRPRDTLQIFLQSITWLEAELANSFDGKTVVVTHFAPHPCCVAPEFEYSPLSPYYVSDCSDIMRKHNIDVWCFGHTHMNCDFVAEGGCRVLSNQRGYPNESLEDIGFREALVFEV